MGHNVFANKKLRWIKVSELCILLVNVLEASRRADIGFEHAEILLPEFLRQLEKVIRVKDEHLQSTLWSANLLNERGGFWHPSEISFDDFVKSILPDATFNREYNLIKRNDEQ